jgi:hypothetical protein
MQRGNTWEPSGVLYIMYFINVVSYWRRRVYHVPLPLSIEKKLLEYPTEKHIPRVYK